MNKVMNRAMSRTDNEKNVSGLFFLKCLLFSYILTAALLLILAFLLYKLHLKEAIVSISIIVIYVVATFFAGFISGKKMQSRKFMWGLIMGAAYFLVLAVISLGVEQSLETPGMNFLTTLLLCSGGGMLGGMVS